MRNPPGMAARESGEVNGTTAFIRRTQGRVSYLLPAIALTAVKNPVMETTGTDPPGGHARVDLRNPWSAQFLMTSTEANFEPSDLHQICTIEDLNHLFLFREWSEEELASVARHARIERRHKGDVLFQQGDTCEFLYILLSGKVQMFRVLPDGREVTLHLLSSGALVACVALFLDKSFPASGRVISRAAELACLQGGPFLKLLAERPDLSRKIIGALAARIGDLADRIESRTAESAQVRLAGWLLDQPSHPVENGRRVIRIEGSKKSVAASLGMTPETFSRSLHALAQQGILEVQKKEIVLLDARKLQDAFEQ